MQTYAYCFLFIYVNVKLSDSCPFANFFFKNLTKAKVSNMMN